MFRFIVCVALLGMTSATHTKSYGSYGSYRQPLYSSIYGGYSGYGSNLKLATIYQPIQLGQLYGQSYEYAGPITASVQSRHKLSVYDTPSSYSAAAPVNIEIPSSPSNINILMKSRSSDINVDSLHETTKGSYKETASQDEPHINRHTVTRPIVQEVREVISPYRKVFHEIQPVQEEIETILPRSLEQQITYAAPISYIQPAQEIAIAPLATSYSDSGYRTTPISKSYSSYAKSY